MSWIKKRGTSTPSPASTQPVQMYNPNQHSSQENQWQTQQQSWYNQPAQESVPQQQTNYWQQGYGNTTNKNNVYGQQAPPQTNTAPPQYQNQPVGYQYNNLGYDQQAYSNQQYNQQYSQNNSYNSGQQGTQRTEADAWSNWGWGDDDNNTQVEPPSSTQSSLPGIGESFTNDQSWNWSVEENKTLGESNIPKEEKSDVEQLFPKVQLPKKSGNKIEPSRQIRGKLETPQWSTESQISQESSDDVVQTSESDKSHLVSQSSNISQSTISGRDSVPLRHSVSSMEIKKELSYENVSNQQHIENKEVIGNSRLVDSHPTPPPPSSTHSPSLAPPQGGMDDSMNPYKRTSGLSHKAVNKYRSASQQDSLQSAFTPFPIQHGNFETPPDNSEHPDSHLNSSVKVKPQQPWPENNEAPINDRNQYLETGQLSDLGSYSAQADSNIKQEVSDTLPPPGLHRMVPGQMEQSETIGTANFIDEPPPGLSRMVLGQNETSNSTANPTQSSVGLKFEPPIGLHRMVPGESSSPETSMRPTRREQDSESELDQIVQTSSQPRSATIGADTPPIVPKPALSQDGVPSVSNRSETIGGDEVSSVQSLARNDEKKTKEKSSDHGNRRHYIEGHNQESDIGNITSSVRNLTVGENLTDSQMANSHPQESSAYKESSESERESRKPPKGPSRDKRFTERKVTEKDRPRRRERDRYSPVDYRDRRDKRDRRYRDGKYDNDDDYEESDYSDKEQSRRGRDEKDYERKYSSLKKDKDRRRRGDRDRDREYYRDSRREYYYGKYDDDYDHENKSRPSSRSDSLHESHRERRHERDYRDRKPRDRDRERDRHRHREPIPYSSMPYDPYNPYYQQYQYYENLRRTNPQAYAEWYRKYYQHTTGSVASYAGDDRASVHSGRSSANEELKESYSRFDQTDNSVSGYQQTVAPQRLTPAKFTTAHIKGCIASGKFVKIVPSFPLDGDEATVEISSLSNYLQDNEEFRELNSFPGPLAKGITHKKTIIEYCEHKIKAAEGFHRLADVDSYVLMWELMILLIRQNGMVVGTDIAELLLKNRKTYKQEALQRPPSVLSNMSSNAGDNQHSEGSNQAVVENIGSTQSILKEEEITNKFREYLLYGSGKEALEWAMKHGLWGHALFLASKLDKRTYANVMMRFANGLPINDPLQTLYQLLSGKMPAAVTCVSDEKWGDWRPHLAMILSNSSQRPELNCKAITSLGDTLLARGCLYAAQFCYLMAQVGFGHYDDPDTKLVLLGADHTRPFPEFIKNEAIYMTEIYEYACSLNDADFVIPEFQVYKYILATRLADRGLLEKSLQYLEKISMFIIKYPSGVPPSLVGKVLDLADRLKYYDPVGDAEDESGYIGDPDVSRLDVSWLKDLRNVLDGLQTGLIKQEIYDSHQNNQHLQEYQTVDGNLPAHQANYDVNQDMWQQQQQFQQSVVQQQNWQQEPQIGQVDPSQHQQPDIPENVYQDQQQSYWSNQQQWGDINQYSQENIQQNNYLSPDAQVEDNNQQPKISMPNQSQGRNVMYDDEPLPRETKQKPTRQEQKKSEASDKEKSQSSTGWFGGIFSKLALKPKNQMKLPDDKNPKIVWDQDKKRWVNVDEDPNDPSNDFKPPPKLSDLMPKIPQNQNRSAVNPTYEETIPKIPSNTEPSSFGAQNDDQKPAMRTSQSNMFKMQRGRNLKNSYVDVFNPTAKQSNGPSSTSRPAVPAPPQMNFFIPQPVNDPNAPADFLTPAPAMPLGEQQQPQ